MKSEAGFTLVEVVVALGVASLVVFGVHAALVSTARAAKSEEKSSRSAIRRLRTLEVLRADFRSALKLGIESPGKGDDGSLTVVLSTAADSLGLERPRRGLAEVRYSASREGLRRVEVAREGGAEIVLSRDPAAFEVLSGGVWRRRALGVTTPLRLSLSNPDETIVLR